MTTLREHIEDRLADLQQRIAHASRVANRAGNSVRLIAVTKNHGVETLQTLIDLGVRDLGENRAQEIEAKFPHLTGEFTMHMIGHLQTNKVKKVWPFTHWIQSIDREKLILKLNEIGKEPQGFVHKKNVLVEVNTSGEASKSGCAPEDCARLCEAVMQSPVLALRGLMTVGPLCDDERKVRAAFSQLRELSQKCCVETCGIAAPELSMGMSGDFEWAIAEGATMIRIGTTLVGSRGY